MLGLAEESYEERADVDAVSGQVGTSQSGPPDNEEADVARTLCSVDGSIAGWLPLSDKSEQFVLSPAFIQWKPVLQVALPSLQDRA